MVCGLLALGIWYSTSVSIKHSDLDEAFDTGSSGYIARAARSYLRKVSPQHGRRCYNDRLSDFSWADTVTKSTALSRNPSLPGARHLDWASFWKPIVFAGHRTRRAGFGVLGVHNETRRVSFHRQAASIDGSPTDLLSATKMTSTDHDQARSQFLGFGRAKCIFKGEIFLFSLYV